MNRSIRAFLRENTDFYEGKPEGNMIAVTLPKRLNHMKKFEKAIGQKIGFMKAFNKSKVNKKNMQLIGVLNKHEKFWNQGRIACHLSHCMALQYFLDNPELGPRLTVFEDDVDLGVDRNAFNSFAKNVSKITNDNKANVNYIGFCREDPESKKMEVAPGIIQLRRPYCRHAYSVNRRGAKVLLDNSFPQVSNGDIHWSKAIANRKLKAFGPKTQIVKQNRQSFNSDISGISEEDPEFERLDELDNGKERKKKIKTKPILFVMGFLILLAGFLIIFKNKRGKNRVKNIGIFCIFIAIIIIIIGVFFDDNPSITENSKAKDINEKKAKPTVTVILLNYKREKNTRKIIKQLEKDKDIDRIVVLNGKDNRVVRERGKITEYIDDFENNEKYGGARRFLYTDLDTEYIVFLDDDILPKIGSISKLVDAVEKNGGISGGVPRICNTIQGYKTSTNGKPDAILTGFSAVSAENLKKYQEIFNEKYSSFLEKTHGNCEDLTFSNFIRDELGESVTYVKEAKFEELDNSNGYSSMKSHYEVRNKFCKNGPFV